MSVAPDQEARALREAGGRHAGSRPLFDLSGIDLTSRSRGRDDIARLIPHRGEMALLDWVVWTSQDHRQGVALKHVGKNEFWVPGHFPSKAMFPGVLMIEAGAQLACYLYNSRIPGHPIVAFLRIEDAAFRSMVQPGDDLYLLCSEVKFGRRRFISDIQGMVGDRIAFDARISGMSL
jgi:3-hydroxymyristoyl/3-hydroxydecanoyl-(acyl carrier protein) dehydratase